jgi:hypothetical protein
MTGSNLIYGNGKVQSTSKSYDGVYNIYSNQTLPNTSWKKMCIAWGAGTTNITLPQLSAAQVGERFYIQNSTSTTLGISCPSGSSIFHRDTRRNYLELDKWGRIEIAKASNDEYFMVSKTARMYPNYRNPVTISWQSWYECTEPGVITVMLGGSYRNDLIMFAGESPSNYNRIAWSGDNFNSNTKWHSFAIPVQARTWVYFTYEKFFPQDPSVYQVYEEMYFTFFPGYHI